MRFLLSVSLIAIGLTFSWSDEAFAVPAQESTQQQNKTLLETNRQLLDLILQGQEEQTELDGKASEEATTGRAAQTKQMGDQQDAVQMNQTKRAQETAMVDTHSKTMNLDAYACSYVTSTGGIAQGAAAAAEATEQILAERLAELAGEPGTQTENGLVDFQNRLFNNMQTLPNTRFSIAELFNTKTIDYFGAQGEKLTYLQQLLYSRVPIYLNQDLLDNPDTETKNLYMQAERLRAEMGIGQSVFANLLGNRAPTEGISTPQYLQEIMESNNFEDDYVQKLLPPNPSLRAQLEALALGQFGVGYSAEKLVENPSVTGSGILFNSMLTNLLLFKQYELLETIAASTSTQVIATREEAIKDVNARISRKNARQN